MHNPEEYQKCIAFQKRDSIECLEKYKNKLGWKEEASIIDLGSGDGYITSNVLKKYVPDSFKEIIGVDISEEMVKFSNKHFQDDKQRFYVMDIAGDVHEEFEQKFDHAFSSSVFVFINDQETAFKNLHKLLKEGGTFLLVFPGRSSLFDMNIILAESDKWKPWSKEAMKGFVSRYHYLDDPVREARRIMKETGFNNIHVENNDVTYVYNHIDDLTNMLTAANLWHVPKEHLDELKEDYKQVLLGNNLVEPVQGSDAVQINYTRMEIIASTF